MRGAGFRATPGAERSEAPDPGREDAGENPPADGYDPGVKIVLLSHSVAQTESIAADLGRGLSAGTCITLTGDLGAGKTQFVRGLVGGLGGEPRSVSSPTFVLLNVYDTGRLTVYHLDAYRATGAEDFEAIGFAELLEQGGVVVVEWPSRVADLLPAERTEVTLEPTGKQTRRITITRRGLRASGQPQPTDVSRSDVT